MSEDKVTMQGACAGIDRTWQLTVNNQTDQTVDIWFAQVRNTSGQAPAGYVTDTGVFVASTNINPNSQDAIDPCLTGGGNNACQGNEITGTLKCIDANGRETDVTLQRASCGPDEYYPQMSWDLAYQNAITGERLISATATEVKTLPKLAVSFEGDVSSDQEGMPYITGISALTGDPNYLCLSNRLAMRRYFSIHWDQGGTMNFTIEPGGSHRVHVGGQTGICYWDTQPIPAGGTPNGFFVQEYAGNCP